jgi:hypothetical protein
MPRETLVEAEGALKAAIDRERSRRAEARLTEASPSDIKALPEAQRVTASVAEFRKRVLRTTISNAHKGPRPKLVEIEFIGLEEDDYDPTEAPLEVCVVVQLPRQANLRNPKRGKERLRGYAPLGTPSALVQTFMKRFPDKMPLGEEQDGVKKLLVGRLESTDLDFDTKTPADEFWQELVMTYASENMRLVSREHEPLLREAAKEFMRGLSFAKIAMHLNEKGYTSATGRPFSAPLAEHVVIQALLMLGAWGID